MATTFNEFDQIYAPPDKAVGDNGAIYDKIQDAIDDVTDWVLVGPGTFSENITLDSDNMQVMGSGRATVIDGGSSTAVVMKHKASSVKNLAVKTTSGGGNSADCIEISNDSTVRTISDIWIEESDQHGIQLIGTDFEDIDISGIRALQGSNIDNKLIVGDFNDTLISDVIAENIGSPVVDLVGGGNGCVLNGITVFENGATCIKPAGTGCTLSGFTCETADGPVIEVVAGSGAIVGPGLVNATVSGNEIKVDSNSNDTHLWSLSTVSGDLKVNDNGLDTRINGFIETTKTIDFGTISANSVATNTIAMDSGITPGNPVIVGPPFDLEADLIWNALVVSTDDVELRVLNPTSGDVDPASGDWTIKVHKR